VPALNKYGYRLNKRVAERRDQEKKSKKKKRSARVRTTAITSSQCGEVCSSKLFNA